MRTRSVDLSSGLDLHVTAYAHQGGRKHMEDNFNVIFEKVEGGEDRSFVFIAILDGHGGKHASEYAKANLMNHIVSQPTFWSDEDELVCQAIKEGFISLHVAMWTEITKWPRTITGFYSTAGTTASVAFIRGRKVYVGHVGDSRIVIGSRVSENPNHLWAAQDLTIDHKPIVPAEMNRIRSSGGSVAFKGNTLRVVWKRPSQRTPGVMEEIPFLAVARSLGDFWSYNGNLKEFAISPVPDISVVQLTNSTKCLIFGSDGLWDVISSQEAVDCAFLMGHNNNVGSTIKRSTSQRNCNAYDPSYKLIDRALHKYTERKLLADNITVVTVLICPPGSYPVNEKERDIGQPLIIQLRPGKLRTSLPELSTDIRTRLVDENGLNSPPLKAKRITNENLPLPVPTLPLQPLESQKSSCIHQKSPESRLSPAGNRQKMASSRNTPPPPPEPEPNNDDCLPQMPMNDVEMLPIVPQIFGNNVSISSVEEPNSEGSAVSMRKLIGSRRNKANGNTANVMKSSRKLRKTIPKGIAKKTDKIIVSLSKSPEGAAEKLSLPPLLMHRDTPKRRQHCIRPVNLKRLPKRLQPGRGCKSLPPIGKSKKSLKAEGLLMPWVIISSKDMVPESLINSTFKKNRSSR